MIKRRVGLLLCLAALGGFGLGEAAWGLSQQAPAFAWPELSRGIFWMLGAASGLAVAGLAALAWSFAFSLDAVSGLRAGVLGMLPGLAGILWKLAMRMPLPPPHDFAARKLQIFLAGLVLSGFFLQLAWGLLQLALTRELGLRPARSMALRLGGLAWIFYLACGAWTATWHVTGDAPHYLLMADSMAYDGNLDLANQYAKREWCRYGDHDLQLQIPAQADGRIYAEHKPLVPLLLAGPYYFLGLPGAQWVLALLAAFGGALFFLLLLKLGHKPRNAFLGWCLLAFSAPWWVHSQAVYVELTGGLFFLMAFASAEGVLPDAVGVLAPALLVWLGLRFDVPAAVLCLLLAWRLRKRPALAALGPLLLALSLAAELMLERSHFGGISPTASYQQRSLGMGDLFQPWHIGRFATALLIDQEFGWLPFVPAYFFALLGWARLRQSRPKLFRLWMPVGLAYVGLVACFPWWYGDMAPNRYLICLSPFFALGAMEAWSYYRGSAWFMVSLLASWAWGLGMAVLPWLCYSKMDGKNWLLKIAGSLLHRDLTAYFPAFMIEKPSSYAWVLVLALFGCWFHLRHRPTNSKA